MKSLFWTFSLVFLFAFSHAQDALKAYVFLAEECPISIYMTPTLNDLADSFSDVEFYAVFPNQRSNYKTMGQFIEKYEMTGYQRILDEDQSISKKFGATVTPEVIIVNDNDEVLYRGEISDAFYRVGKRRRGQIKLTAEEALTNLIVGHPVATPWPKATGCFITFINSSSN